jgi:hypothetical protein
MAYFKTFEQHNGYDERIQWIKLNPPDVKLENERVVELSDIAMNEFFDMYYVNDTDFKYTKMKKLDKFRPILRYVGIEPKVKEYVKSQHVKIKEIYNNDDRLFMLSRKDDWHKEIGDKSYVPKTVFTKADAMELKFPIIAKSASGHSGLGIQKFKTPEELKSCRKRFDVYSEAINIAQEFRAMFVKDNLYIIYERIYNTKKNKTMDNKNPEEEVQFVYIEQDLEKLPCVSELKKINKDFRETFPLDFYSIDFCVDDKGKVWVIESNLCSGLHSVQLASAYVAIWKDFTGKNPSKQKMDVANGIIEEYRKVIQEDYPKEFKDSKYAAK